MTMPNTHSPFSLAHKRILVTGASSGLGRQIAIASAAAGATIILGGRNTERLQETLSLMTGSGHIMIPGDLTQDAVIAETVEKTGEIDGVVHCTGVSGPIPARLAKRDFIERLYNINVFTPELLTNQLLAKNKINRNGSILFLSSTAAVRGVHGMSVYSGSKAALIGMARCLALETAKRGIRVNCLAPDLVETPMLHNSGTTQSTEEWLEQQRAAHPLGLGTPDDVANAAIFFMSQGSRWITGTTLIMDGGITY